MDLKYALSSEKCAAHPCWRDTCQIGDVRIYGRVENFRLGCHVRIDDFAVVVVGDEPVTLENYVHVATHCHLGGSGGLELKSYSALSTGCRLISSTDAYDGEWMSNPTVPPKYRRTTAAPIVLEEQALLGANTVVLPGVTIGQGAKTGALALVTRDCAPWSLYTGQPAELRKHFIPKRGPGTLLGAEEKQRQFEDEQGR